MYQTELVPLVPYLFFDEQSAKIPDRYLHPVDLSIFAESKLSASDPLSVYQQSLNVIGKRLADRPMAKLTVVGTLDNNEFSGPRELARERAEAVKHALMSSWNIPSARIQTRAELLPQKPSAADSDGMSENRRVELTSTDPLVLAPVLVADTVRITTPPSIRFHSKITGATALRSWSLQTSQDGKELKAFQGADSVPQTIDWTLADDQSRIPRAPGTLDYELTVQGTDARMATARGTLPVEQRTLRTKRREIAGNAEIEKYTLLLFGFNSSELSSENQSMLDMIKARLQPNSTATIQGFRDRIGSVAYNKTLAMARAHSAAKALSLPESVILPSDGKTYPQDNNLPEGRFYSRTVQITIRTPTVDRQ